jgi:16S rRNA (guanine966-N2)-methyltransferase
MKSPTKNRVRIGAGEWRSRLVSFPDVDGLRPTADRVRQTVFNWLGQSLTGKVCLDAFAGSGALGLEAASRGATRVLLCENNALAVKSLRENIALLQATSCEIVGKDVIAWLKTTPLIFDVVFCDPPFAAGLHAPFLAAIHAHLTAESRLYIEADQPLDRLIDGTPYEIVKSAKAGAVYFGLLRLATSG